MEGSDSVLLIDPRVRAGGGEGGCEEMCRGQEIELLRFLIKVLDRRCKARMDGELTVACRLDLEFCVLALHLFLIGVALILIFEGRKKIVF